MLMIRDRVRSLFDRVRSLVDTGNKSILTEKWNRQIKDFVRDAFLLNDNTHGIKHAIEVEHLALGILKQSGITSNHRDCLVVSAAALLHDVGRAKRDSSWSSDEVEHISVGVKLAADFLSTLPPFKQDPLLIEEVCYLIFHHDDTNYSFPIMTRGGEPTISLLRIEEPLWKLINLEIKSELETPLRALREADGCAGTGYGGAKRTLQYSLKRDIKPFALGNALNAWMWEESAVGNTRLAMKRAMLDASTLIGKRFARQGYLQGEKLIEDLCKKNGVKYQSELVLQAAEFNVFPPYESQTSIELTRARTWDELVMALKNVKLRGDASLYPYAAAKIECSLVDIDHIYPLSRYVLSGKLKHQDNLRNALIARYGLDIFDLGGMVEYNVGSKDDTTRLVPPIVEVYDETTGKIQGEIWALVDGTHRVELARRKGIKQIRAIVIRDVPKHFPLMALPLQWSEVNECQEVPVGSDKRYFRHSSRESSPDISWFSSVPINTISKDELPYFFFRDLEPLGSAGPRKAQSKA